MKSQNWPLIQKTMIISYALSGMLFIGYQINKAAPDFRLNHIFPVFKGHFLFWWGCLSLLFLIPFFRRISILSFLHSLVFFLFIVKDILGYTFQSIDRSFVQNDLSLLLKSILLQTIIYLLVLSISFFLRKRSAKIE